MTTPDFSPEDIIEELINADRAYRWAMYNSDFEASWAKERDRWNAAERAAFDAYPGMADRLEDPDEPDPAPVAAVPVLATPPGDYLVHWSFPPACTPELPDGHKWTSNRTRVTCPACNAVLQAGGMQS